MKKFATRPEYDAAFAAGEIENLEIVEVIEGERTCFFVQFPLGHYASSSIGHDPVRRRRALEKAEWVLSHGFCGPDNPERPHELMCMYCGTYIPMLPFQRTRKNTPPCSCLS